MTYLVTLTGGKDKPLFVGRPTPERAYAFYRAWVALANDGETVTLLNIDSETGVVHIAFQSV